MKVVLPSKKFMLQAGSILILVGILVFVALYEAPLKQSKDSNLYIAHKGETLGDAIKRDSDKDGVPDWEEKLFDLDPNNPDTKGNGEGDAITAEHIRTERRQDADIEITNINGAVLNETDALTRDLYMAVASLSQGRQLDATVIENLTALTSAHLAETGNARTYTLQDITIIPNSTASASRYIREYDNIVSSYQPKVRPVGIINQIEESGDTTLLNQLDEPIERHQKLRDDLLSLDVPANATVYHLDIINALESVIHSIENMQRYTDDPILAMIGVFSYYENMANFADSIERLNTEYYQSIL